MPLGERRTRLGCRRRGSPRGLLPDNRHGDDEGDEPDDHNHNRDTIRVLVPSVLQGFRHGDVPGTM